MLLRFIILCLISVPIFVISQSKMPTVLASFNIRSLATILKLNIMLTWPNFGTVITNHIFFGTLWQHIRFVWSRMGIFPTTSGQNKI